MISNENDNTFNLLHSFYPLFMNNEIEALIDQHFEAIKNKSCWLGLINKVLRTSLTYSKK